MKSLHLNGERENQVIKGGKMENCTRECLYVFARWLPVKQNICDHTVVLGERQREREMCDLGVSAEELSACHGMKTRLVCTNTVKNRKRKNQYSSLVQIWKHRVVFPTKAATTQLSLIGKKSHAELREDQKVRDAGRGMAVAKSLTAKSSRETPNSHRLMCLKRTLCTRNVQIYYRHFDCMCLLQFFWCRNPLWGQNNHGVSPRLFM